MRNCIIKAFIACLVLIFAEKVRAQAYIMPSEIQANTQPHIAVGSDAVLAPTLSLSVNMERVSRDIAPIFSLSLTNPSMVTPIVLDQNELKLVDAKIVRVDGSDAPVTLSAIELGGFSCEPVFWGQIAESPSLAPGESISDTGLRVSIERGATIDRLVLINGHGNFSNKVVGAPTELVIDINTFTEEGGCLVRSYILPFPGLYDIQFALSYKEDATADPITIYSNIVRIQLEMSIHTHTISGKVTYRGVALPGVTLTGSGTLGVKTTDSDGNYSFTQVPHRSTYTITPSKAGYTFSTTWGTGTLDDDVTLDFSAILGSTYTISGTLVSEGNPLPGVTITDSLSLGTATTDANGDYSFTRVRDGTAYTLTPSKADYIFSPVSISGTTTGDMTHDFTATPTYTISGTITVEGSPLSGVLVKCSRSDVTSYKGTDANGNYSFTNLVSGTAYTLSPSKAGYTFSPVSISGTATGNMRHDFTTTPTYTISGTITVEGSPLSGVLVKCSGSDFTNYKSTGASGSYSFTNLVSGTAYTLTPSKHDTIFMDGENFSFYYAFNPVSISGVAKSNITHDFTATHIHYYTVSGKVTSSGGNPIAMATVAMTTINGTRYKDTNASGDYRFVGLPSGDYVLTLQKIAGSNYSPPPITGTLTSDLTQQNFTVIGDMFDNRYFWVAQPDNVAFPGVTVVVPDVTFTSSGVVVYPSNAYGAYLFTAACGTAYTITPSKTGYTFSPASVSGTVVAGKNLGILFTATPVSYYSISGTITSEGNPLPGATVTGSGSLGTKTTDARGNYNFAEVISGTAYTITPSKAGYTFNPASSPGTLTKNTAQDFTANPITIPTATYSISGTITSEGNPLPGATVTGSGSLGTKTTDARGNYNFAEVISGTAYTITPSKAGYTFNPASSPGTLTKNTVQDFTATFITIPTATYSISGTITSEGNPLPGATVTGSGSLGTKTTDARGNYNFAEVINGTAYTITPSKVGYTFNPASSPGTLTKNTVQDFTATFITIPTATYSISGTITSEGNPLPGATVTGSGSLGTKTTDARGNYNFAEVISGTAYTITPSKAGYTFNPASSPGTLTKNTAQDFTANPITIPTATYSISGAITSEGRPVSGVRVTGSGRLGTKTTDARGKYSFTKITTGTAYVITPSKAGYTFSPVSRSGTLTKNTAQRFTANHIATYTISGKVTSSGSRPVSGVRVTGSGRLGTKTTDARGKYSFTKITTGTAYVITPSKAGYTFSPVSRSGTLTKNTAQRFTANRIATQ